MPLLWILKYWKIGAFAALLAAALIYREVLVHQRDDARAQVKTLTEQSGALQESVAAMRQAVARQNGAVAALAAKARADEAAARARESEADRRGAALMRANLKLARRLRNAPIPGDCAGAIRWGNARGPELGTW
jgi:biopolymer transport protein ExbB/TolQ